MDKQRPDRFRTSRVCPYYRLPQLAPGDRHHLQDRRPLCTAWEDVMPLSDDVAAQLCRSGKYPTCERFQAVHPNWHPASGGAAETTELTGRRILSSIAWVIGIPLVITMLIVLAIWFTENVWVPTESAIIGIVLW